MATSSALVLSLDEQARILVEFVSVRGHRLELVAARSLLESIQPNSEKEIALALRKELLAYGITLKHMHSLTLAGRLAGRAGAYGRQMGRSNFSVLCTGPSEFSKETYTLADAEDELVRQLRPWLDGRKGAFVVGVLRDKRKLYFSGMDVETAPFAALHVLHECAQTEWDAASPRLVERLRRLVEDANTGFLDGYLSARFGYADDDRSADLVAMSHGIEAGRGTELSVFAGIENLLEQDFGDARIEGNLLYVGGKTFEFTLDYAKFKDGAELRQTELNELQMEHLLKRYRRVRRLFGPGYLRALDVSKLPRPSKGGAPSGKIDVAAVKTLLAQQGRSWEWLLEEVGHSAQELEAELDLGTIVRVAELLSPQDYNRIVGKPNRRFAPYATESLLRTLLVDVNEVRFVLPRLTDETLKTQVREVCQTLHASRRTYSLINAGAFETGSSDVNLFSVDADEFLEGLHSLGMTARAGWELLFVPHEKLERPAVGRRAVLFIEPSVTADSNASTGDA